MYHESVLNSINYSVYLSDNLQVGIIRKWQSSGSAARKCETFVLFSPHLNQ